MSAETLRLVRICAAVTFALAPLSVRGAEPTKPGGGAASAAVSKTEATPPGAGAESAAKVEPAKGDPKKGDEKSGEKKGEGKKEEPKLPYPSPSMPDWKLEVMKEKPDIRTPSVVCAAPDGRIFVAEDPMDQQGPANKPGDRVLCLHPDGKVTVFADKLYAVFGMDYYDGKVLIHHSPKFTVYTDDNGVGKDPVDYYDTDNPATWGGGNLNDHIPAQIRLGMDGFYYMSVGDKGVFGLVSNVDKSTAQLQGGGVIRFRPDGTKFETFASGTRNHLDISVNAEDEIFSYDNTDDGLGWWTRFAHLVDGGFYGYPYDYRPHESDADGMAKWKVIKDDLGKAKADYEKAVREATKDLKTDQERTAAVEKLKLARPSQLPPAWKPYALGAIDDFQGGSPCGAVGYNEDALPPEYRGNLFHTEWGKQQVERYVVERTGATYKIVKRDDKFLKGGSQPFRPLGICVTADGMGFYVTDWNYSGWNSKTEAGRLMKLTWTGKSQAAPKPAWYVPAATGKKFEATTAELVAALKHPAQSVRLVAQRRVGERGAEAVPALVALLNDGAAPAHARWSAVWTLDRIDEGRAGRGAIVSVVGDETADVSVRMQAARQLGTRQAREGVPALLAAVADKDAALRFKAAAALGRIGDAQAVPALLSRLSEPDQFARFAVFTALNRIAKQAPGAWEPIVSALSTEQSVREGAALAMRDAYEVPLVEAVAAYATTAANPPAGRATAIGALAPLARQTKPWNGKWWGTQPQRTLPPARDVDWSGTGTAQAALRRVLDDADPAVRAAAVAAQQVAPDPAVADVLVKIYKQAGDDAKLKKAVLRGLAASKSPAAAPLVTEILAAAGANKELLPDALTLAVSIGGDAMREALTKLLSGGGEADLLVSAADTLGKLKDAKAVPALAAAAKGAKEEKVTSAALAAIGNVPGDASLTALTTALKDERLNVRKAAAGALATLKTKKAIPALLEAAKEKDLSKEALNALAQTPDMKALDAYLTGMSHPDGTVRSNAGRAIRSIQKEALPAIEARLDTNPLPTQAIQGLQQLFEKSTPEKERTGKLWKFDTKSLSPDAFATFARNYPGDAKKGQAVFRNANVGCVKCHKVGNEGTDVGPMLNGIGTKYDRQFLVESILQPSKQILDGYQQTIVRLKNGDVQSGIVRGETATEVTLFDAAGEKQTIAKDEIKEREHGKLSLMPEGLHTTLKPEEFSDLIAYLESLKDGAAAPAKK